MRRPCSPLREGCGAAVAWLAAAALMLQVVLATPMPLLTTLLAFPVCSTANNGADPGAPVPAHRHDECLLCQGSGPPLLASATAVVPTLHVVYLRPPPAVTDRLVFEARSGVYAARAPPRTI